MVTWPNIVKFIRSISRIHLRQVDRDYIRNFSLQDVNWEHLAVLAEMEGVAGFLYYHLRHSDLDVSLPESVTDRLENHYRQTAEHTFTTVSEIKNLSVKPAKVRIPVIALQGLSAINLYNDPGLRPLGDVDLMVDPSHKEMLKGLFLEAGYRPPITYPYLLHKNGMWIDIHTHILNLDRIQARRYLFPEDLASMWNKAVPFFDDSDGVLRLDPLDNFVALAAHALKHSYSRTIWLVDLHESLLKLTGSSDDWEDMVKRVKFWRQEKVVLYALILMQRIFDLQVPAWVEQKLGIHRLSALEKYLLRLKQKGFSSGLLCQVLWLATIKKTGDKLKFIWETAFPQTEIMAQIRQDHSWDNTRSSYAKRIAEIMILAGNEFYRALILSLKTGWKG